MDNLSAPLTTSGQISGGRGFRIVATAAAFAGLFAFAVILSITPASVNQVGRFYHAGPSELGMLFLVQAIGFLFTVMAGGWLSDRRGKFPVLMVGCAVMAVGVALFAVVREFGWAFFALFLTGAGGGLTEGVAMAAVSDLYGGARRTSMLNLAQVAFAVGAVSAPSTIAVLINAGLDWRIGYYGAAGVCGLAALASLAAVLLKHEMPLSKHGDETDWRKLAVNPLVISLSIGILLYVGAESGQGFWLAAYLKESLRAAAPLAASSVAIFWAGIGTGRLAATWASTHISDVTLICIALAFAAISQIVLLLVKSPVPGLVAVFFLGLSLGPIWPTILSRAGASFSRQSGTVFGILVAMGAVGSAIFPPVVGRIASAVGIHSALWVCVVASAVNLVIFLRLRLSEGPSTIA